MASPFDEPRDLLAERLRRLEGRLAQLDQTLAETSQGLAKVTARLDALVDLVGRLGRVIDVQGTALHSEETDLGRRLGNIAERVDALGGELLETRARLEEIRSSLALPPGSRGHALT